MTVLLDLILWYCADIKSPLDDIAIFIYARNFFRYDYPRRDCQAASN